MNARLNSIGKFLVGALTGAAALAVVLEWYNTPKGKLQASFVANAYEAAPIKGDSIAKLKGRSATKPPILAKPEWFGRDPNPIGGYLDGRVENAGSKDVKNVVLTVPEAISVCIERSSKDWTCQGFDLGPDAVVTIGDLRPLESAGVQIWLSYSPIPNLLSGIKLTHSEGVGRISFETLPLPQKGAAYQATFLVITGLLTLVTLSLTYRVQSTLARASARAERRSDPPENG
jgi:hypothetical protein